MSEATVKTYIAKLRARTHALRTASNLTEYLKAKSRLEEAMRDIPRQKVDAKTSGGTAAADLEEMWRRVAYSYRREVKIKARDSGPEAAGIIMYEPITTYQEEYDQDQAQLTKQHADEMDEVEEALYATPAFYKTGKFWGATLGLTTIGALGYYFATKK
jgi:hypothetical protein